MTILVQFVGPISFIHISSGPISMLSLIGLMPLLYLNCVHGNWPDLQILLHFNRFFFYIGPIFIYMNNFLSNLGKIEPTNRSV